MKKLSELFATCADPNGYEEVGHSVNYKFEQEGGELRIQKPILRRRGESLSHSLGQVTASF